MKKTSITPVLVFALLIAFPLVRGPMMFVFCVFGAVLDACATLLKSKFLSLLLEKGFLALGGCNERSEFKKGDFINV
jgi:hypothetical protein